MKSDGLLSLISFSSIRKELLFNLMETPMELQEIRECLNVTSQEIIPRIKELQSKKLIFKDGKKYYLTPIGVIITKKYKTLINYISVIEEHEDYWNNHRIESIPEIMLGRIDELKNCKLIVNTPLDIDNTHKYLLNNIQTSQWVLGILSIFHSDYLNIFLNLSKRNIPISLIITKEVYEIFTTNYNNVLHRLIHNNNNFHLYTIDGELEIVFFTSDAFLSISLYNNNGDCDYSKHIFCQNDSSIDWGKELFEYYKHISIEIT